MRAVTPLALALALVNGAAFAESHEVTKADNGYQYSDSRNTFNAQAAMSLTPEERSLAKQWMLNDSDWVKYKQIMEGPRGIWSPGLDPLTALGVSETDPKERARYAEIWMRVEAKRKEGELAFERARSVAAKIVFGDMKAVNNEPWISEWNRKHTSVNKAVAYFVQASCLQECKENFDQISASVNHRTRLDVYFQEGAVAGDISQWAQFMGIAPEIVRDRKITLNFDQGTAAKMGINTDALPQIREMPVN